MLPEGFRHRFRKHGELWERYEVNMEANETDEEYRHRGYGHKHD